MGVRLAEMEQPLLKKMLYFSGKILIYVRPSFYEALKLKFPMDVGVLSRDGRVTTELRTGSLRYAVGIRGFQDRNRH